MLAHVLGILAPLNKRFVAFECLTVKTRSASELDAPTYRLSEVSYIISADVMRIYMSRVYAN